MPVTPREILVSATILIQADPIPINHRSAIPLGLVRRTSHPTLTNDDPDSRSYLENAADELGQTEDMSHIEGIEMLTGLHYGDGERSQGLSTGVRQGRLIRYDMESAKLDQQARVIQDSDRKKRQKGEYMCTDCGTSDSPEWRKGPEGPKTLCNACGCKSAVQYTLFSYSSEMSS